MLPCAADASSDGFIQTTEETRRLMLPTTNSNIDGLNNAQSSAYIQTTTIAPTTPDDVSAATQE